MANLRICLLEAVLHSQYFIFCFYKNFFQKIRDTVMTEKIISSLNIKIPPRDLKYSDPKAPLQSLFNLWIPLARSLLNMVVEYLPSPRNLADDKVLNLICAKTRQFRTLPTETQKLKDGLKPLDFFSEKNFNFVKI